ncbi:hypothetical protein GCM10020254_84790 [Streptomyces goshikiensis]
MTLNLRQAQVARQRGEDPGIDRTDDQVLPVAEVAERHAVGPVPVPRSDVDQHQQGLRRAADQVRGAKQVEKGEGSGTLRVRPGQRHDGGCGAEESGDPCGLPGERVGVRAVGEGNNR